MGTTNKPPQNALRKLKHSSRQSETAVITNRHTVGEYGPVLNRPRHYYKIVQEVFYHQ